MRRTRIPPIALVLLGLTGCGGAGGDTASFCDEATDRVGAFRDDDGRVSPAAIGVLRELALEAPDQVAADFEVVTEATAGPELDQALVNIEQFLVEDCGLEVRG